MTIETLPFEHRPRNSIANNLDKINELIDWVNLDTHLYTSASGERVTVGDASSLKGLTVDGRSVQDGTPTPDAPVEVQVVHGGNLQSYPTAGSRTQANVTIEHTNSRVDNVTLSAAATANVWSLRDAELSDNLIHLDAGTYTASCPSGFKLMIRTYDGTTWTWVASYVNSPYTFTLPEAIDICTFYSVPSGAAAGTYEGWVQLEAGSTATPYVPYGSIGLVVGDTATPIDLQGNTLASLPDGTRDELHVDSAGHVWIEKRVNKYTIIGNESIWNATNLESVYRFNITPSGLNAFAGDVAAFSDCLPGATGYNTNTEHVYTNASRIWLYISNTYSTAADALAAVANSNVYYKLATPQTIELGYIDMPTIPSGLVVTVSASLTSEITLEWWVDDGVTALVNDLIAYVDYKTEG